MEFVLWSLLMLLHACLAKYRMLSLDEGELCNENKFAWTRSIRLGAGAAIIKLEHASLRLRSGGSESSRCAVHVRAAPNFGLALHVESLSLRRDLRHGDCVDSIRFGRDDLVPLFTLVKSQPYCGHFTEGTSNQRITFDDPGGKMIIWLDLGPRDGTRDYEAIGTTNLSLVITAYQKNCGRRPMRSFKKCQAGDMCISQHYFCDKHVNCVADYWPADELECQFEETTTTTATATTPSPSSMSVSSMLFPLMLVLVAFVALLMLVVYLSRRGQNRRSDQGLTLEELSHRRGHRRRLEDNDNVYVVVNRDCNQNNCQRNDEPPPAYHELFPNSPTAGANENQV